MGFAIKGVDFSRRGIVQLGSSFDSILLYFLMEVAGAHAHSSRGFPRPSAPGIWPLVTALKKNSLTVNL